MNIFLWILQILLAIHTVMGAIWKFSNSEQTVASLRALPQGIWLTMGVLEIFCALCLILPVISKKMGILVPAAASFIVAEMLIFIVLHIFSPDGDNNQMLYWVIVAVICGFLAFGRFLLKPIN